MSLLKQLKEIFSEDLLEISELKGRKVKIEAPTLSDALKEAAALLRVSEEELDYRILKPGGRGLFGRKNWVVMVSAPAAGVAEGAEGEGEEVVLPKDVDGSFSIRITKKGIFLTVFPPVGKGVPVSVEDVTKELFDRKIMDVNMNAVEEAVNKASGEPVKIGEWTPNPEWDARAVVEISDDEMEAKLTIIPPRYAGRDLDYEDIIQILESHGVVVGIKEDVIRKMLEERVYNKAVVVAEGIRPVEGEDAKIEFKVKVDKEVELVEKEDGTVDFRELNLVTNVVKGQVLAEKIPPKPGIPGRTVTNKVIPVSPGKDVPLPVGKNTHASEDGLKVIADIDGQVVFRNNKLHVEPVLELHGGVNADTGNILFVGNVIVWGDVEDTYEVRASGDIIVHGNIGKAYVEAEGNVMVDGGIRGKEEGKVKAKNDIVAKFVDNSFLEAGRDVIVAEYIMHSVTEANRRVVLHGKQARIVGGETVATEEIVARTIGSETGVQTVVEVGINPALKRAYRKYKKELDEANSKLDEMKKNLQVLERKRRQKLITEEEEETWLNLSTQVRELEDKVTELKERLQELDLEMQSQQVPGRVSVYGHVYPGVTIIIRNIAYQVREDNIQHVTFLLENDMIVKRPYQPTSLKGKRKKKS